MNTSALIMMIVVELTVTILTGYFFYKVLTTETKPDDESESD